jgi:hypothetical protein
MLSIVTKFFNVKHLYGCRNKPPKTLHHEKIYNDCRRLFTGIFAQNTKPQLEAVGNQVKATYHHEKSSTQQQAIT